MADTQTQAEPLKGITVPEDISGRVKRGRGAMGSGRDIRRQSVKFFQNEPYWYIKSKGGLGVLPTALDAVDKASYRVRKKLNLIPSMVQRKVSAASQRVPGYEVDPASTDPDDISGARLGQQILFYGWDKYRMRRLTVKTITNAIVQREGFAMPYFDPNVGPFHKTKGGYEGEGEVRFLSLSRDEVGWEPGMDFDDSRWHIILRAMLPDDVKKLPGYVGGDLKKNAITSDVPEGKRSDEMCEVIEYLERPCPDYPEGRRCFIAEDKIIVDARKVDKGSKDWWEDYPYRAADDKVIDEPCIHRISYTVNIDGKDDMGLVELLIDPQLTILDCWNKILEMKNRALMLQAFAPKGSNLPPRDDTPGATWTYNPVMGMKPEWEPAPDPQYLAQLREILEQAKLEMRAMAGDIDIQPEPDLAAKTLNAAIEQAQAQWQVFLGDVAEFHSRLGRHVLTLVARHYDRERLIQIRGQYGWEPTESFKGSDLHSQVNVRVLPGSIETKTRQSVMQEIMFIQQNWPGAISPEVAMAAVHGGNAEGLFKTYDLHVARAWSLVQKIRTNPESVFNTPNRQDFEVGDPALDYMVSGWMPRPQDNLVIWKQVIADYMITPDYDEQDELVQQVFGEVWAGLEWIEQMKAMKLAAQEANAAADQGQANAAKPQGQLPGPAAPGPAIDSPEKAAPAAMTPE